MNVSIVQATVMAIKVLVDDDLMRIAHDLIGVTDKSELVRSTLKALIERALAGWHPGVARCLK
jgi:Arc/MetJ family transcription regulator